MIRWILITWVTFGLSGCAWLGWQEEKVLPPAGGEDLHSDSYLDRRLMAVVERQQELLSEMERRLAEGEQLSEAEWRMRFEDVAAEYDSILVDNPEEVLPLILYGKLLRRLGERENAHTLFMRANSLDPKLAVVKQQLGNYYAEEERPALALALYMEAIALQPEEAVYYFGLGQLLVAFRNEFLEDKEAFSEEALDRQILEAFRTAMELAPQNDDFQMRYGEAFYDVANPDWEMALAHWNQFQEKTREGLQADAVRLHRARVLMELGRLTEAREMALQVQEPVLEASRDALLESMGDFSDSR